MAETDLQAALELHRWGIVVLPCGHKKKYPLLKWEPYQGVKKVTENDLRAWFGTVERRNLWILCGPQSGIVVFDCDGPESLKWWRNKLDIDLRTVPRVKTSKGWHFYFAWAEGSTNWTFHKLYLGTQLDWDVRNGESGGVIAPPSTHESGHEYVWEVRPSLRDDGSPIWPPLPPPLYSAVTAGLAATGTGNTSPTAGRSQLADLLANPPAEGGRNDWLTKVAGHHAKHYRNQRDAYDQVFNQAAREVPGLTVEEVEKTRESVWKKEHTKPEADPTVKLGTGDRHELTDMGNARRLIDNHQRQIRYVGNWRSWLVWDERRWVRDELGQVELMAKHTIRSILSEAVTAEDDNLRRATTKWAYDSQSARAVRAMTGLAQTEEEVAVTATSLDSDPALLNLQNGTYDWYAGTFRDHSPDDLLTKLAGTRFEPSDTCPHWQAALERWLPDPAVRQFAQKAVGYSLTADLSEKCLFVVYGPTDAGKSVFIETVYALTGDYGHIVKDDTLLLTRNKGGNTDDLADLQGVRFASLSETPEGARLDTNLIKRITGGSPITAMRKFEHPVTFQPTTKFWIDTNHRPKINADDDAIWNRVRPVPFDVRIPPKEQDKGLRGKLLAELPGILNWALAGLASWKTDGLGQPSAVREAAAEYRESEDPLQQFLDELYERRPGTRTKSSELHRLYLDWSGEHISTIQLVRRMESKGHTRRPYGGIQHYQDLTPRQVAGKLPETVQNQRPQSPHQHTINDTLT